MTKPPEPLNIEDYEVNVNPDYPPTYYQNLKGDDAVRALFAKVNEIISYLEKEAK